MTVFITQTQQRANFYFFRPCTFLQRPWAKFAHHATQSRDINQKVSNMSASSASDTVEGRYFGPQCTLWT